MTVSADYKRKIFAIRDLPTLPIIAQKIMSLGEDDEKLAEKLGTIIASDQSLSVKVLTLANSAYYGHRAQVGTIKKAVVVIGTAMLRQFSLGILVSKGLGQGSREREAFWRHSLIAANAASAIAKLVHLPNTDVCFMGGLLHDVGRLVLDTNMPKEYKEVTELVRKTKCTQIEAEQQVFDTDHTEVGTWMAERWQLPPELVQSIGYHHSLDIAELPHARMVAVVHAASICADAAELMDITELEDSPLAVPFEIESALGIPESLLKEVVLGLHHRQTEIQTLFR